MTTKDIHTTIDKTKAEIYALEKIIIPELEEELTHLKSLEYTPDDLAATGDTEGDISWLSWELWEHRGDLNALQEELKKLYRKLTQVTLGPRPLPSLED